ncbi:MAG: glycosyltransferase, partial [Acidimicrobiia bacterium]|nr:glycosyltransferase [Acidimicrobiia bacterium]
MTFAIAAAGTGGHVYPGLAVGEALVAAGIRPSDIVCIGGDRLEATVFPDAGFPFEQLGIRGLQRGKLVENLGLPGLLHRARARALAILDERKVKAVLGFGNYITVPVAMAARRRQLALFVHEQNAHPGMANRLASRWAQRSFVSFPDTPQLHRAEFTGNPLRQIFREFDRDKLRPRAIEYYGLRPQRVT